MRTTVCMASASFAAEVGRYLVNEAKDCNRKDNHIVKIAKYHIGLTLFYPSTVLFVCFFLIFLAPDLIP